MLKKELEALVKELEKTNKELLDRLIELENQAPTAADIDDEVRRQKHDLEEQSKKLYAILSALPGKIVLFDQSLSVIEYHDCQGGNEINIELTGDFTRSFGQEFQDKIRLAMRELQMDGGIPFFKSDKITGASYFEFEDKGKHGEEERKVFSCSISCNIDDLWVLHIADMTESAERERLIQIQQSQVIQASKMSSLGEMAGGIAHEVNNPLSIITGMAHRIKKIAGRDANDPEAVVGYASKIEKTVDRISKTIIGLRMLSRNASNDEFETVSLVSVVNHALSICREKFNSFGIELDVDVSMDLYVAGQEVQLSQVVLNLLNNSFDAIKELDDPWIKIFCVDDEKTTKLYLVDSGKGIDEDQLERIFDPFYTTKEIGEGTGLGMSVSKQIVRNHKGSIGYELYDGHTSFYIELPLLDSNYELDQEN